MTPPMRLPLHLALLSLLAPLGGCVIGGEKYPRPRDLDPSWLVDRTRILAIRAEPPEIRPGESATFEALLPQPELDEPWPRIWFACELEESSGAGCFLDLGTADLSGTGGDIPEGLIGFEPGLPPAYTAPDTLLDGIDDPQDRSEGVQVLAQVSALPLDVLEGNVADVDFNEVEVGFKRLIVSEATTPNRNPLIAEFVVDRLPVPPGAAVRVEAGQIYEIGAVLEEALIEEYEFLNSDGQIELREEEPYATWYATGGEVLEPITLYPYNEASWLAPDSGEEGTWYVVIRDRRGGMTWHVQDWVVD